MVERQGYPTTCENCITCGNLESCLMIKLFIQLLNCNNT